MVDLRVDGGRVQLLVAQHLRDLRQRTASPEHHGRGGVTQPVSTRPAARPRDDTPRRPPRAPRAWSADQRVPTPARTPRETRSAGGTAGSSRAPRRRRPAAATDPAGRPCRASEARRPASRCPRAAIAATSPPRNPSRDEQQQDRVITAADRSPSIATRQQAGDHRRLERTRQRAALQVSDPWDRPPQRRRDQPRHVQIHQQRAQLRDHATRAADAPARGTRKPETRSHPPADSRSSSSPPRRRSRSSKNTRATRS